MGDDTILYIVYMILDKFIIVKMSKPNIRFYKDKYKCKVGDLVCVEVCDLSLGISELVLVKCDICGFEKRLIYRKYIKNINRQGFYTCSSKCSSIKKKNTCTKNFGFDSPLKSPDIRDKVKGTCLIRYGFDNPNKSDLVKQKTKNTCRLKYSSDSYVNSDDFKLSMLEKYGVENPMQSFDINNKRIKSSFEINEFESIKYQGKYELDFLEFCKKMSIFPIKPNFSINYIYNDVQKIYLPDFFIENKNLIIEIKSTYYFNLHKEKNILKKNYTISSGYNYLLIVDKDYDEFENYMNNEK
jgi:hypothetical protein